MAKTPKPKTTYPHNFHRQATFDFIKACSEIGFNKVSFDTVRKGAKELMRKLKIK